ncbi:PTS glucose transporter subunit IIA [Mycoplasma capricolum subsp. capripneumoniae]|uniref:PTS glucose transporter subunit IIA n=1 Tax=Mycoplasma capricolum subsp. capripneumoniae 87001 TaxID=1124992 RepID=A0A9N7AXV3_MYCCC|nr:glucose PTS transporter subunit IIA [Mycoplasma capricolum]AJK51269.1 PTS glucose transporter subunit IIA [Mycoplasma capricolum subsp. capripneumoniae 87001]AQU77394.1 PTS glucose transporter subunit IIA [Mycoplasma capricolum subsp. capripneumoniae]KEY84282.1 Phosphotransferase system PTS, glucose-specific IIABC component [Mycoplasma capricolum subsp. capripneumoniae 99108]QDL19465.1 PTS glucose transporter subunit IIA [Mycoplasma capricolum subsp. capripneumoniae]QDL20150.1 PTS glucose t
MWFFNKNLKVLAPCDGTIITLDEVEDEVFKERMLGNGFAINPKSNDFYAPVSGKLVTAFPTKHAFGIQTKSGVEILLHIGLDTVSLDGNGFESFVTQDQEVNAGDKLVTVDLKSVAKKVPSIKSPIIFTNNGGKTLEIVKMGEVKQGDVVAILK